MTQNLRRRTQSAREGAEEMMLKAGLQTGVRVRDVMTQGVMFLRVDNTLEEAWHALHQHGVSGAPVLDVHGKMVGIVSKADLADPRHRPPTSSGGLADAMTRVIYAVRADDPVMWAVHLMMRESVHRVLVLNEDGTVAGILVPMDVLRAIARGRRVEEPPPGRAKFVPLGAP
jgi:CBS-domain-containing membrane protein